MIDNTDTDIRVSPDAHHSHIAEYVFDPQPNITLWELAQCVALIQQTKLHGNGLADYMRKHGIARHFVCMTY